MPKKIESCGDDCCHQKIYDVDAPDYVIDKLSTDVIEIIIDEWEKGLERPRHSRTTCPELNGEPCEGCASEGYLSIADGKQDLDYVSDKYNVDRDALQKKKDEVDSIKKIALELSMPELVQEIEAMRLRYGMKVRNMFHLYILMDTLHNRTVNEAFPE